MICYFFTDGISQSISMALNPNGGVARGVPSSMTVVWDGSDMPRSSELFS